MLRLPNNHMVKHIWKIIPSVSWLVVFLYMGNSRCDFGHSRYHTECNYHVYAEMIPWKRINIMLKMAEVNPDITKEKIALRVGMMAEMTLRFLHKFQEVISLENVRETENAVRADLNGCHLLLLFEERSVEGVFEKIQGILSSSYDERVLKDMGRLAALEASDRLAALEAGDSFAV